jgi:uncharacterized protein YjbI with pentapeptide repeats
MQRENNRVSQNNREVLLMRTINREELAEILELHDVWVASSGIAGARAVLFSVNFANVSLRGVNLDGADLHSADLRDADLQGTCLVDACLAGADLQGADLRGAKLEDVDFCEANLCGAKFSVEILDAWSIWGARFSPEALPWLMLRSNWLNETDVVHICET